MHRGDRLLISLSLVGVLAVGACGGSDGGSATPTADRPSSTTGVPATSAVTTTTTAASAAAIVLRGDGLGVVDLGAKPDVAITAVSVALGDPSSDTGWESASGSYGTCPGERIRGVEWDHLVLLFTDGDTAYGHGEHLFTWRLTGAPPALGTAKGLGFKATVADAEELYPGDVEVTEPDEPFPGFVTVAVEGGIITGYLDGEVITNLEAGSGCSE